MLLRKKEDAVESWPEWHGTRGRKKHIGTQLPLSKYALNLTTDGDRRTEYRKLQ